MGPTFIREMRVAYKQSQKSFKCDFSKESQKKFKSFPITCWKKLIRKYPSKNSSENTRQKNLLEKFVRKILFEKKIVKTPQKKLVEKLNRKIHQKKLVGKRAWKKLIKKHFKTGKNR